LKLHKNNPKTKEMTKCWDYEVVKNGKNTKYGSCRPSGNLLATHIFEKKTRDGIYKKKVEND
jgi:hypothetical protein